MNAAPRLSAATALRLAALAALATVVAVTVVGAVEVLTSPGAEVIAGQVALIALPLLMLAGWGIYAVLGRHGRFDNRLAYCEAQLGIERHARQLAEHALADTHTSVCRLIHQQDDVRENERKRIARDIHDDLGQHLLALKIELSLVQVSACGAHPQLFQQVGRVLLSVDLSITSLRAIINNLHPRALEPGLQSAMATHLVEFSRLNGIPHELDAGADAFDCRRDGAVDAMLFRVLQEALANVVRHAEATEVKVALRRNGDQLNLQVRDNGIGMAGWPTARGCGLVGIADRAAAAGGRLVIDSEPGAGTVLSVTIPLVRQVSLH